MKDQRNKRDVTFHMIPGHSPFHLPHLQYARLFLQLVSKRLTFWPVCLWCLTEQKLSPSSDSTFTGSIQIKLLTYVVIAFETQIEYFFSTNSISDSTAVNMRTIEIQHCAHVLKIKYSSLAFVLISPIQKHYEKWWNEAWNDLIPYNGTQWKWFVPYTPSFCDHIWSHLELF